MDLDNFDFKPITDGLGFDKKAEKTVEKRRPAKSSAFPTEELKLSDISKPNLFEKPLDWQESKKASEASRSITEMLESLPPSLDFKDEKPFTASVKNEAPLKSQTETKIYQPVGRTEYVESVEPTKENVAVTSETVAQENLDVSLNNTLEKAFPQEGFRRPFFHQSVEMQPQFTSVPASFTSAVLDTLVITGLMTLLLVGLVLMTGTDLIALVLHSEASKSVWIELGIVYFSVYLIYYATARGAWGSTLGDWAFDITLGADEDRRHWTYYFKVIFRMFVIGATGFIFLPILSLLLGKDTASSFCGVKLFVKNY